MADIKLTKKDYDAIIDNMDIELSIAKGIIRELCGAVRALNNPNTQLTDINGFLQKAETFLKE